MKLKELENILKSGDYNKIKPMLRMEVRNKSNLHDSAYYNTIVGDIVSVVTAHTMLDDERVATCVLTKSFMQTLDVTTSQIISDAIQNTTSNFKLSRLSDIRKSILKHQDTQQCKKYTLDCIDTLLTSNEPLDRIVVVTIDCITRISILQFPDKLQYIYNKIGDYYIIPSSLYEVIIIPLSMVDDIDYVNTLIEHVNDTSVEDRDVLEYKLLKYDSNGLSMC